ncbi:hypothetical protein [Elizabethkingia meningoseptica]|nr:hypothetical protein [Elizabethkingia meningoseptica]
MIRTKYEVQVRNINIEYKEEEIGRLGSSRLSYPLLWFKVGGY